jgi:hypothetical protein
MSAQQDLIFLSWGGAASQVVAAVLQPVLQNHFPNVEVFFSPESIEVGDDPMKRLFDEGLDRATALVAVLTKDSAVRPWVVWETASVWARDRLVVPLFVDLSPGEVPGPLTMKVQGARVGDRDKVDEALTKIGKSLGVTDERALDDEEWLTLTEAVSQAATAAAVPATLPGIPAGYLQRTVPLHDGLHEGTLLAIEVKAHHELDQAGVVMTAITGPPGAVMMPAPARLFWHPGRQVVNTIAPGANALIHVAREGPDIPGALLDSPDQHLPWSLINGRYRVELQLTARGFAAQLFAAEFIVRPAGGLRQSVEWADLAVF